MIDHSNCDLVGQNFVASIGLMFQPPSPRLSPSRGQLHDRPVCRIVSLPGR
jgi:hypothetical protein